jgi:hypothetical protein
MQGGIILNITGFSGYVKQYVIITLNYRWLKFSSKVTTHFCYISKEMYVTEHSRKLSFVQNIPYYVTEVLKAFLE